MIRKEVNYCGKTCQRDSTGKSTNPTAETPRPQPKRLFKQEAAKRGRAFAKGPSGGEPAAEKDEEVALLLRRLLPPPPPGTVQAQVRDVQGTLEVENG